MAAKKKAGRTSRRRNERELIADLEAKLATVERRVTRRKRKQASAEQTRERDLPRFSPAWVSAHRERLQLSAEDYGLLVGVSALTIYNWEKARTRPRPKQLEALAAVRGLGKREAWERLENMGY